ncbi:helix-turn-helix transcriptional regulator [Trichocoleus sp. DQ-A3]|uniref:helix-turn-helix domain-containing protein n=1 Tax=Cyanophyceae TaxID=3028117 RepID=UPI001681D80E|nr:helix-turn-helix transcriptional regulator [Coleofasciculus sp. FACHB-125]MBD1903706.1 helix-turn-helix transcriptional regulator [Coleofasciculus sp. FACHB-125]
MPVIDQSELTSLVRETRQRLGLSQTKFAQKLGVSFQSVNRWENGRTKPLPIALKQIEYLLHQMGDTGKDLLVKYFSKTSGSKEETYE